MKLLFFIFALCVVPWILAQTDILSISSFQTCVSIDSRYAIPSTADNATTYLNCSTNTATLPKITVVDLRLAPGIGAGDVLNFDISIVPSDVNNFDLSASSPTVCNLRDPTTQLCTITTPATVKIVSTNIVYKYQLTKTNFEFPFCYASVAIFEQFKYLSQECLNKCLLEDCDDFGTSCIPIQYSINSMTSMINHQINTLKMNSNIPSFKLSTFNRVQQPYDPQEMLCGNFNPTHVTSMAEGGLASQCVNQFNPTNLYAVAFQGNLRNFTVSPSVSACPNQAVNPPSSTYCRSPTLPDSTLLYDNPNIDVRVPAFMTMPSILGITPKPVYRNLLDLPVTTPDDLVDPVNITVNSLLSGSVTYGCVGYECGANQDLRRTYVPNPIISTEGGLPLSFPAPFLTTANSIVALNPLCTLYYITPIPQTFAEIEVDVTTNPGTANEHTENLVINNFEPYGSSTSNPYRFVFGRIETIQTTNDVQGPAIQGAIMMCGGIDSNQFINMQCLIDGVECDDTQKVNLDQSTGFSEAVNPWDSIIPNSQTDFDGKRTRFYPHPYDYMKPDSATNQKTSSKYIPGDHGQTFWYYINIQRLINDFRSECNGIGMGVGVNGNQQNANLFCNLEPHACLPGLGQNVNGGLKLSVPCKVSQFMNLASGLYDGNQFPYPYGYSSPDEAPGGNINDQFLNWMRQNATSFMPTNYFINQNTTGQPTSLYDPTSPQFWLGLGGGEGGSFLYFSPTTNNGTDYVTNANVELVLDIVGGTFLEYTASVAQGKINVDQSFCNIQQGGTDFVTVSISNLVSSAVFSEPTEYTLSLNCNELNGDSGLIITADPETFPSVVLNPGETRAYNFTVTEQSNIGVVSSNQISCIATMRYATVLAPDCDTEVIDCRVHQSLPATVIDSGASTPDAAEQGAPHVACSGFCDLKCRINAGDEWQDGCWWIMILFMSGVGILFVVAVSMGFAEYFKTKDESSLIIANSDQYVQKEKESSERILRATGDSNAQ